MVADAIDHSSKSWNLTSLQYRLSQGEIKVIILIPIAVGQHEDYLIWLDMSVTLHKFAGPPRHLILGMYYGSSFGVLIPLLKFTTFRSEPAQTF